MGALAGILGMCRDCIGFLPSVRQDLSSEPIILTQHVSRDTC